MHNRLKISCIWKEKKTVDWFVFFFPCGDSSEFLYVTQFSRSSRWHQTDSWFVRRNKKRYIWRRTNETQPKWCCTYSTLTPAGCWPLKWKWHYRRKWHTLVNLSYRHYFNISLFWQKVVHHTSMMMRSIDTRFPIYHVSPLTSQIATNRNTTTNNTNNKRVNIYL